MTSRACRAPIMSWSIALGSHGSTNDEPRAGGGPFLAAWVGDRGGGWLRWRANSTSSHLRSSGPRIISARVTSDDSYSRGKKRVRSSGVFAKTLLLIWLPLELACSSKVCRSAVFLTRGYLDLVQFKREYTLPGRALRDQSEELRAS